jgi:hypothetical protein
VSEQYLRWDVRITHFLHLVRVFLPVLRLRLQYYLLRLRIIFKPKKVREKIITDWGEDLCPIGANPFELMTVDHSWTSTFYSNSLMKYEPT